MHKAQAVGVIQGVEHLTDQVHGPRYSQRPLLLEQGGGVAAADIVHDEEEPAIDLTHLPKGNNLGVPQLLQDASFAEKSLHFLEAGVERRLDGLQGEAPASGAVHGQENQAHPALAQKAQQLIRGEVLGQFFALLPAGTAQRPGVGRICFLHGASTRGTGPRAAGFGRDRGGD